MLKPLHLAQYFSLHKCTKAESQNITDYIATLRSLSLNCGYEADLLDFTLRDIFIAGVRNAHIQRELLTKDNALSFADACTIAKQLEVASKEVSKLTNARADTYVKTVASRRKSSSKAIETRPSHNTTNKHRCGSEHRADTCKHRTSTCQYCNKNRHIESDCFSHMRDQHQDSDEESNTDSDVANASPHREHQPTSNSTRTKKALVNRISDGFYDFYSDDFI